MKLQDALDAVSMNGQPSHVYSEPYQTADGATIIAVSKIRGKASDEAGVRARPIGVFVIRGGDAKFVSAVDSTPIAVIGVLTGLIAATLATAAMIRRPPWPDIRIVEGPKTLNPKRILSG